MECRKDQSKTIQDHMLVDHRLLLEQISPNLSLHRMNSLLITLNCGGIMGSFTRFLASLRQSGLLSGGKTVVFIDNHDTQRSQAGLAVWQGCSFFDQHLLRS